MHRILAFFGVTVAAFSAASSAADAPVCGTGGNASLCFASIDQQGKTSPAERRRLAEAGATAIDVITSPAFETELAAFVAGYDPRTRDARHQGYWKDFDPKAATAATTASFQGLHVVPIGGVRAWFSARLAGNLAYEGSTRADGSREILLNRNRLDRPVAGLVGTYVHEAAHKAGYSHRGDQNDDQKCEPPYVMGQIAEKLADPASWPSKVGSKDVCGFFKTMSR